MNKKNDDANGSVAGPADAAYTFLPDLAGLIEEIPPDTIISREVFRNEELKAILFGFAAGQELSEHTASRPALLHFLEGEAEVTLGQDKVTAQAGSWSYMPAHLPHSINALTATVMLLLMI